MGQVLSCETGLIPRCRSRTAEEKATSSMAYWLAWEEPRAVGDLVHVEKFFARNLGGLTRARSHAGPAREGKSRTPSMYADERARFPAGAGPRPVSLPCWRNADVSIAKRAIRRDFPDFFPSKKRGS